MTTSVEQHRMNAPATVNCFILTISDTRTEETDASGALIKQLLDEHGYSVGGYAIVPDDYEQIRQLLHEISSVPEIEAILLSGGTGISPRDTTYEAVRSLLSKELPGFGELFRYLSFTEDVGSAALLSRAIAGTLGSTAVFSMPGSTGAVKLAMERLVLPELRHVIKELYKL